MVAFLSSYFVTFPGEGYIDDAVDERSDVPEVNAMNACVDSVAENLVNLSVATVESVDAMI